MAMDLRKGKPDMFRAYDVSAKRKLRTIMLICWLLLAGIVALVAVVMVHNLPSI